MHTLTEIEAGLKELGITGGQRSLWKRTYEEMGPSCNYELKDDLLWRVDEEAYLTLADGKVAMHVSRSFSRDLTPFEERQKAADEKRGSYYRSYTTHRYESARFNAEQIRLLYEHLRPLVG